MVTPAARGANVITAGMPEKEETERGNVKGLSHILLHALLLVQGKFANTCGSQTTANSKSFYDSNVSAYMFLLR